LADKIELPLEKKFRIWLLVGSFAAVLTGILFTILLTFPLVVFKGDFLNGNVAITWYSLKNYGEPVYHPGLSSISLLSIPTLIASVFNIIAGLIMISRILRSKTISHILVEMLIGALTINIIFTGAIFVLRLDIVRIVSVLPTNVGGLNSAGLLVAQGSVKSETFVSVFIGQLYPLALLSSLLVVLAAIIGFELLKILETLSEKKRQ